MSLALFSVTNYCIEVFNLKTEAWFFIIQLNYIQYPGSILFCDWFNTSINYGSERPLLTMNKVKPFLPAEFYRRRVRLIKSLDGMVKNYPNGWGPTSATSSEVNYLCNRFSIFSKLTLSVVISKSHRKDPDAPGRVNTTLVLL